MNAIIYTRVSTDDQAERGHSLPEQQSILERYCHHRNIRVVKHFVEDYSGKTFDRPAWNALKAYSKINKKEIDLVLVSEWDRLGRNQLQTLLALESFKAMGIEINSVSQPLSSDDDPDSIVMRALNFAMPEADNLRRRNKVIGGTRRALKDGYFVYRVPLGYRRCKIGNKAAIEPCPETSPIIKHIFLKYSKGAISQDELRAEVHRLYKTRISKTNMLHLLKRETYIGKIRIKAYKGEPAQIANGLHEGIITEDLFNIVQQIITQKSPARKYPKRINESFPLRGHLVCSSCGKKLTASRSKGRNSYYHYYHCDKSCGTRHKIEAVHEATDNLLKSINIPTEQITLFKFLVAEELKQVTKQSKDLAKNYNKEMINIEQKVEEAEQRVFDGQLPIELFNRQSEKYKNRLTFLKSEIANLSAIDVTVINQIDSCSVLLSKLDYWYRIADFEIKRKIIGSIFPNNLVFEKSDYRTAEASALIRLIQGGTAHFDQLTKQKNLSFEGRGLLSWSTRART
jgi:site-specific DNA recombinase